MPAPGPPEKSALLPSGAATHVGGRTDYVGKWVSQARAVGRVWVTGQTAGGRKGRCFRDRVVLATRTAVLGKGGGRPAFQGSLQSPVHGFQPGWRVFRRLLLLLLLTEGLQPRREPLNPTSLRSPQGHARAVPGSSEMVPSRSFLSSGSGGVPVAVKQQPSFRSTLLSFGRAHSLTAQELFLLVVAHVVNETWRPPSFP